MGYYGRSMGDNYNRGDYYRGDPGFFSSLAKGIGKVAGAVTGVVARVIPGPVGLVAGAASRALSGSGGGGGVSLPLPPGNLAALQAPIPGIRGFAQRLVPGGASGYTTGACTKKDGTPRRVRADGGCYKRPSMNVANSKAANRAIRRIKGVRDMLRRIESQMPKRAATAPKKRGCGCK